MSDPYEKLSRGEQIADLMRAGKGPFNAAWFNDTIDAIKDYQRRRVTLRGGDATESQINDEIYICNVSTQDLPQGAIVGVGAWTGGPGTTDPELQNFLDQTNLESASPTTTGPFAVLLEPIPYIADPIQVGRAVIAGVVKCLVDFSDATHKYAAPAAANYAHFVSQANRGPVLIIDKDSGTGELWALVCIDQNIVGDWSLTDDGTLSIGDQVGGGKKGILGQWAAYGDIDGTPPAAVSASGQYSQMRSIGFVIATGDPILYQTAFIQGNDGQGLTVTNTTYGGAGDAETANVSLQLHASAEVYSGAPPPRNAVLYTSDIDSGTGNSYQLSYSVGVYISGILTSYDGQWATVAGLTFSGGLLTGGSFTGIASVDGGSTGLVFTGTSPATLSGTLATAHGGTGSTIGIDGGTF